MKKIALLLTISAILVSLTMVSCKKDKKETPTKSYSELIVGRWKTDAAEPYFEVYNANGSGKMWDTADDVQEDEADTFDWTMDEGHKQFTQIVHFQGGQGDVPQMCNIITLNETTLKYNNDALKREVTLTRVQ